jgi:hypothetical protein
MKGWLWLALFWVTAVSGAEWMNAEVVEQPQSAVLWVLRVELKVNFTTNRVVTYLKRVADGRIVQVTTSSLK